MVDRFLQTYVNDGGQGKYSRWVEEIWNDDWDDEDRNEDGNAFDAFEDM